MPKRKRLSFDSCILNHLVMHFFVSLNHTPLSRTPVFTGVLSTFFYIRRGHKVLGVTEAIRESSFSGVIKGSGEKVYFPSM